MNSGHGLTVGDFYGRARSAMAARSKLVISLSLTVGTSVFIQLVTVASGVILARALGPQGRGDLAIAMLWPILVSGIGMLGVADALTFRTAREGMGPSVALTSSLLLALFQSLLLGAVGWAVIRIALHRIPGVVPDAQFYLWYIPLNLLTLYPGAFLQGRMLMRSFNVVRASVNFAYSAFLAALWATSRVDVHSALAASLAANAFTLGLCGLIVLRGRFLATHTNIAETRSLMVLGLKLHLGNVAFLLASRIDIVMLSFLVPPRILGDYVVATAVGGLALLIPSATSLVLYPLFSQLSTSRADRPFALFMLIALPTTLIACPIAVLASPLILKVFFGSAFGDASAIAQILSVSTLVRGISIMVSAVLRGLGSPMRASGGDLAGLAVMTICLIPAIRLGQGEGAAYAVLLGTAISAIWMIYHGMRVVKMTPRGLVRAWGFEVGRGLPRQAGPQ